MFWWTKQRLGIMKERDIIIPEFDASTFVMPFQMKDTNICDDIIKYYENDVYYKHEGYSSSGDGKKSTDVNVFFTCNHPAIVEYRNMISDFCRTYFEWYDVDMSALEMGDAFNIQHYKPGEGFYAEHYERTASTHYERVLVFMTYLNTVEDGGGTHFRFQNLTTKAEKGLTLLWPSEFTHIHKGIISPTEHKYIATGWFNFVDAKNAWYNGIEWQKNNKDV